MELREGKKWATRTQQSGDKHVDVLRLMLNWRQMRELVACSERGRCKLNECVDLCQAREQRHNHRKGRFLFVEPIFVKIKREFVSWKLTLTMMLLMWVRLEPGNYSRFKTKSTKHHINCQKDLDLHLFRPMLAGILCCSTPRIEKNSTGCLSIELMSLTKGTWNADFIFESDILNIQNSCV